MPDAEYCDCPAPDTPVSPAEWCGVLHTTEDRYRWVCSRREGHDGPHSACVPDEHPAAVWGDEAVEASA